MTTLIKVLGYAAAVVVAVFLLLCAATTMRVSADWIEEDPVTETHPFSIIRAATGEELPWLPEPHTIHKERLGALDAVLNGLTYGVLCACILAAAVIVVVLAVLGGLFTGEWAVFGGGIILLVLVPLMPILMAVAWLVMFFQPCTPGYVLTWLLFGLPCMLAGVGSNVLVFRGATVIIEP